MKKNIVIAITAMALAICCGLGVTLAWLMDTSDTVVNTFTYGDINIELTETNTNLDTDENANTNLYKMLPGNKITKDPEVTVKANSEASYLFVKIEKSANFDTYMTYAMADGWTALDGVDGVYYREVAATTADTSFDVIKDNTVTVKDSVTKEQMTAIGTNYPTLTFTAYAVQKDNVADAAAAWAIAQGN